MFDYTQMFQWDRFITPSIIKPFYSLMVGIVFARIIAEFILIVFRINEHLGAIRDQGMR